MALRPNKIEKVITLLVLFVCISNPTHGQNFGPEQFQKWLTVFSSHKQPIVQGRLLYSGNQLFTFYKKRQFKPAWTTVRGPTDQAFRLVDHLSDAYSEGLKPQDYHLDALQTLIIRIKQNTEKKVPQDPTDLTTLDFLLTDAFFMYGFHLVYGRTNPQTKNPEWVLNNQEINFPDLLEKTLSKGRIGDTIYNLKPKNPAYTKLRKALAFYRQIERDGGWPNIDEGPVLGRASQDLRVIKLRFRLLASKDLKFFSEQGGDVYDRRVETAVKRFQRRHKLRKTGVIDATTRAFMNVSVQKRIEQIIVNMERWRWAPFDFGEKYVLVNIANFKLSYFEGNNEKMSMRVVVGKPFRQTPLFSSTIPYLVVNPVWTVPAEIAVSTILPGIKKYPAYYKKRKFSVYKKRRGKTVVVRPKNIGLKGVSKTHYPFLVRQEPGPFNEMGKIKFVIPNKNNIILHDTPGGFQFKKSSRAFSSGCIRLERPVALARQVLSGNKHWNDQAFTTSYQAKKTQSFALDTPIKIHLLYWTVSINNRGEVQFLDDVYSRDAPLYRSLTQLAPQINR
jgi:L,D-transpeptidase YcbB